MFLVIVDQFRYSSIEVFDIKIGISDGKMQQSVLARENMALCVNHKEINKDACIDQFDKRQLKDMNIVNEETHNKITKNKQISYHSLRTCSI